MAVAGLPLKPAALDKRLGVIQKARDMSAACTKAGRRLPHIKLLEFPPISAFA